MYRFILWFIGTLSIVPCMWIKGTKNKYFLAILRKGKTIYNNTILWKSAFFICIHAGNYTYKVRNTRKPQSC